MALRTLGTNATSSLKALQFNVDDLATGLTESGQALMALLQQGIFDDQTNGQPVWPGAFSRNGLLSVPNRGILKVLPGDVVAIDTTTGWPILLSNLAFTSGPWTTVAPT